MSHRGHDPFQHYMPPQQPQYAPHHSQQDARQVAYRPYQGQEQGQEQEQEQERYRQQHVPYSPGYSQPTGGSYASVSSLGTGNSHVPIDYHVSGLEDQRPGHGHGQISSAYRAISVEGTRHREPERPEARAVFEMPGESAQPSPYAEKQDTDPSNSSTARMAGDALIEQRPVQANPWPFYLDPSPGQSKQDVGFQKEDGTPKKAAADQEPTPAPVQAFPWPYHGPSTEEDAPRATVHPPAPSVPTPETRGEGKDKPLPPVGNDESVLDDILSDMDAQDAQDENDKEDEATHRRPAKDPTLRPPPLNISRPTGSNARLETASGAVSPGGRTYIPYRPGASPTTSSPPAQTSPPLQQQQSYQPLVTAPHHVYVPHSPSTLSPPPQTQLSPPTTRPGGSLSPQSGSLASGQTGFSPYRPPSPQVPQSVASPGFGLGLGLGSPTAISGDPHGFSAYQPSQTHSGVVSPTHPVSPALPPPRQTPSPRPPSSPQPGRSPRLPHVPSAGYNSSSATAPIPPYPASPPRVSPSPGAGRPGTASSHSKPASPAPQAFYPPPTTQQAPSQTPPEHGRLASPPAGAMLSRPSSRNDSTSVHSGVSSAAGGAPVYPAYGQHGRPSPTAPGTTGDALTSHHYSPQPSPQQQQYPSAQSPAAPSPYHVNQQSYVSPTVSSPYSPVSPHPPAPSIPPQQPPRPTVSHSTTLPTTLPSPTSPPPPYTVGDLPPRPGSAGASYQGTLSYSHPPPPAPQQSSTFPSQPAYAPSPSSHHQQQGRPPNMNQNVPPLPPRPSTSHNGRPPPPPPRPQQGFGSGRPL